MNEINPIRLYKVPEAANFLGVSTQDVRALINDGQLKAKQIRKNAYPRISGKALLDFVDPQMKAVANA